MRGAPVALFSGIGRRTVQAILVCGLAVLVPGLLLQAGKQQRQYRELHQQQLRQAATQAALTVRSRLSSADLVLRSYVDTVETQLDAILLRSRLQQTKIFESAVVVEPTAGPQLAVGTRQFQLSSNLHEAIAAEHAVVISADGSGNLYLLRALSERPPARWVLAEISNNWLWQGLKDAQLRVSLLATDSAGQQLYSTLEGHSEIVSHVTPLLQKLRPDGVADDIAWVEQDKAWVGAVATIGNAGLSSDLVTAMVALDPDRPWPVAFWSALRTQSTTLPLLLLLAAWFAHSLARHHSHVFRQLRRALAQLPERRVAVVAPAGLVSEVRELVDSYNRTAEALEAQAETRTALDEIDGLLLPGGDHENVIDQVLTRVRGITRANNVGLTLIDTGVSGHGRMFLVNAEGGCPVNRVTLDEQMVATLRDAKQGLTVVRCEAGRHSFLEPLQGAGSTFFWVWPVAVEGGLAAILSVGYVEPPTYGARVAAYGAQCAQRLGIALSGNARADQLYRQAHFDPLTQLPNRLLFRDQLAQELRTVGANGARGALFYIDLDHFKKVNDSLGHTAGDQVLSIVAQRLRACVKDGDTVARLGGDEFTVILRDVADVAAVSAVADRMINSIQLPVRLGAKDHHVHASIGIALFPGDSSDLDGLIRNADLAMYCAKDLGRGAAVFYSPKMGERGARVVDSGMHRALTRREFSLYFQPQYSVNEGSMVGVEALLRWQKPREGMVPTADFIPAAEESGLIVDLGGWVFDAVCAQIAQWREQGINAPRVAVNLSVQQLRDPELVTGLRRTLERHTVQPAAIELEMNEAALTDPDSQVSIEGLSAMGVRLTLDDFGTGHTALANLRRYPVVAVKIDRSFVDELADSPAAAALASTIIVMAHSLGKQVIAEGVETVEQLDYLRERGCDFAQGYFMAQPLSAGDMTELLIGRNPETASKHSAFA
ncbi:MAG: EAL domain-containing protein [Steroidobacteraceae bacterium]